MILTMTSCMNCKIFSPQVIYQPGNFFLSTCSFIIVGHKSKRYSVETTKDTEVI